MDVVKESPQRNKYMCYICKNSFTNEKHEKQSKNIPA